MDRKVVVLGLDGVAYTLLNNLMERRYMPNLASIVEDGTFTQMQTTIPDISSVAWTSFMTGRDPGGHGIFGFTDVCPHSHEVYFTNSTHILRECLWDLIGRVGKRSVIVNVPATYPARAINGVLIAGFVATDLKKAVYPKAAYEYLKEIDYRLDVDTGKSRDSADYLIDDLNITLEKRIETIYHFWESEEWDLFIGVLTETDRINHFLWDAWGNENNPYHGAFIDYYKKIDHFLGTLYDRFLSLGLKHPTSFMMMSDHGFTKVKGEVYINHWLKEEGLLAGDCLGKIDDSSKAFALDQGRIYINRGETAWTSLELRRELFDRLSQIEEEVPFLKGIFHKEELYHGPLLEKAPDLILLPEPGFILKGDLDKDVLFGHSPLTGTHTQDDAFFFINDRRYFNDLKIYHIAPLILETMGLYNLLEKGQVS